MMDHENIYYVNEDSSPDIPLFSIDSSYSNAIKHDSVTWISTFYLKSQAYYITPCGVKRKLIMKLLSSLKNVMDMSFTIVKWTNAAAYRHIWYNT